MKKQLVGLGVVSANHGLLKKTL